MHKLLLLAAATATVACSSQPISYEAAVWQMSGELCSAEARAGYFDWNAQDEHIDQAEAETRALWPCEYCNGRIDSWYLDRCLVPIMKAQDKAALEAALSGPCAKELVCRGENF